MRVDLIWLQTNCELPPPWAAGQTRPVAAEPAAIARLAGELDFAADYYLFWDATLRLPDVSALRDVTRLSGDVWHAGLLLGMGGLPRLIDAVDPVWRLNRDPAPDLVAMSWRLSLRACLVRADVLRALGGPDGRFESLAAASLELGRRWVAQGALMRHVPALLPDRPSPATPDLPLADEFRFLRLRYGRMWTGWAWWRAARRGRSLGETTRALRASRDAAGGQRRGVLRPASAMPVAHGHTAPVSPLAVSILIPTLDRYPHLFNLLDQLRAQTVPPLEIIVVDQTELSRRDTAWPERFGDLPLRVIWRDQAGQCSSRNAGLRTARGDAILFLDDDDEIEPDLIARHLEYLAAFGVDASCGVAEEAGAGALPAEFTYARDSDVFPTNNSLLRVAALRRSGLFDLAYEKGERADGDLGMRLYLSGAMLGLNPAASVVHLHAPRGGLRQHRARVVTRSASRASIWYRHLLAPTEAYLWCRYFSARQVDEALLIRTVGTVRGSGRGLRRVARAVAMALLLPDTWRQNRRRLAQARAMLADYPSIPTLEGAPSEELQLA